MPVILVVDDEEMMLTLVEAFLRKNGYTVIKASSAKEALMCLDTTTPDLFILDVMMPEVNGISLCRQLRSIPATATKPIVFFSAANDEAIYQECFRAGASTYMGKFELPRIVSVIGELLKKTGPDKALQVAV
jgi:CheY-like chemotaxis protein